MNNWSIRENAASKKGNYCNCFFASHYFDLQQMSWECSAFGHWGNLYFVRAALTNAHRIWLTRRLRITFYFLLYYVLSPSSLSSGSNERAWQFGWIICVHKFEVSVSFEWIIFHIIKRSPHPKRLQSSSSKQWLCKEITVNSSEFSIHSLVGLKSTNAVNCLWKRNESNELKPMQCKQAGLLWPLSRLVCWVCI